MEVCRNLGNGHDLRYQVQDLVGSFSLFLSLVVEEVLGVLKEAYSNEPALLG
jgi:hypothetical protein